MIAERPSIAPTPDVINACRENAALIIRVAAELGVEITTNTAGVEWLDGYVDRNRSTFDPAGTIVDTIGGFVGESIIAEFGGEWMWYEPGLGVRINERLVLFPMIKAQKHIEGGEGDSMSSLMTLTPVVLARQANEGT